ncbi:MAG: YeeE/YedE family protein [Anaerolineaceae bacterium]|nr:YeeE/YedE family protein [Anaerolineaceae bacterium]
MQPIFPLQPFLLPFSQNPWTYAVFAVIGFFFGYVLEISGFGNSKKLAAQFYFKDLTVLKVMFTAIVTAMVLIFLSSAIGILDFNLVYVPETHLWPGIVGGVIMGVGFIIGGFCPGTSLVSASTLKVDGIVFLIGALFGVWAFGETVQYYWSWWNSSGYLGRLTLMDVFHLPTGVVVLLVVFMALFMFWGGEQLERIFGKRDMSREPRLRFAGAGALVLGALAVILIGQPTTAQKWAQIAPLKEPVLTNREVQIAPGEVLTSMADDALNVILLDVRPETDYNLFHLYGARNVQLEQLDILVPELLREPPANTVYVVMSNDEQDATLAWMSLTAESISNVYILEGGVNNWLRTFAKDEPAITPVPAASDRLAFRFSAALGQRYDAANPDALEHQLIYTPKIKLERKRSPSGGGCG